MNQKGFVPVIAVIIAGVIGGGVALGAVISKVNKSANTANVYSAVEFVPEIIDPVIPEPVVEAEVVEEAPIIEEKAVVKTEVKVQPKVAPVIPVVAPVITPAPVIAPQPVVPTALSFECNPYLGNPFYESVGFNLELKPNIGTLDDYSIGWETPYYKDKVKDGVYRFFIPATGKFGLAFKVKELATDERYDFKCSVQVIEEPLEEDDPEEVDEFDVDYREIMERRIERDLESILKREYQHQLDVSYDFTVEEREEYTDLVIKYRVYNTNFTPQFPNNADALQNLVIYWEQWMINKYNEDYSLLD